MRNDFEVRFVSDKAAQAFITQVNAASLPAYRIDPTSRETAQVILEDVLVSNGNDDDHFCGIMESGATKLKRKGSLPYVVKRERTYLSHNHMVHIKITDVEYRKFSGAGGVRPEWTDWTSIVELPH